MFLLVRTLTSCSSHNLIHYYIEDRNCSNCLFVLVLSSGFTTMEALIVLLFLRDRAALWFKSRSRSYYKCALFNSDHKQLMHKIRKHFQSTMNDAVPFKHTTPKAVRGVLNEDHEDPRQFQTRSCSLPLLSTSTIPR